jgi:hypothetical protein
MAFNQTGRTLHNPELFGVLPETTPRSWEEQRIFDRSSQGHWMFPSTESGD